MAFKMNTSIGEIHAKIQGTKPHAKAIAAAKAPTPATGNVGMPTSPFNQGSPLAKMNGDGEDDNDGSTYDNPTIDWGDKNEKKSSSKEDPYKKAEGKDKDLGSYVKKQKSLTKGTPEWNANQNKINKAYGVKKRYSEGNSSSSASNNNNTDSKNNDSKNNDNGSTKSLDYLEYQKREDEQRNANIAANKPETTKPETTKPETTKPETPKPEGPKSKRELRLAKVKNKVKIAKEKIDSKGAGDTSQDTKIQQSKSKKLRKKAQRIQGRMDRKAIRKGKGTKEEKKADISTSRANQRNKRKEVNSEPKNNLIDIQREGK